MVRARAKAVIALILKRPSEATPSQRRQQYNPPADELFQVCSHCPEPNPLFLETVNGHEIVVCGDCGGRVLLLTPDEGVTWVT